jgi:hypothetical protein
MGGYRGRFRRFCIVNEKNVETDEDLEKDGTSVGSETSREYIYTNSVTRKIRQAYKSISNIH